MNRNFWTRIRITGTGFAAALLAIGAAAAHAADLQTRHHFEIPAQALDTALLAFSTQADVQVLMWAGAKVDKQSSGANGELAALDALKAILANTGLEFRQIDAATVAIVRPEETAGGTAEAGGLRLAQAGGAAAPGAPEPQSENDASAGLEEIVVTAQKREERLEDVPVSITVFTRSQIERSAIVKFEDYANFTPGLNAELGSDERSYEVTIRGIGQLGGSASNFGLYLDEFELTGAGGVTSAPIWPTWSASRYCEVRRALPSGAT